MPPGGAGGSAAECRRGAALGEPPGAGGGGGARAVPVARAAQEVATGSLLRDWSKGGGEAPRKKVAAFKVGLFACQMGSL